MAKRPSPGQTKSRLTPELTPTQAASLYAAFLQDALALAHSLPGVTPLIAFAPPQEADYFRRLLPNTQQIPQIGETLGERLDFVLRNCLRRGFERVAAMNSDSPTLPAAYVRQAFQLLDEPEVDVVLGPSEDGGYYLIGWKRPHPSLVRGVAMSTPHVLDDTLAAARSKQLQVKLLPKWYDVDEIEDLRRLEAELLMEPGLARHTRRFLASSGLTTRRVRAASSAAQASRQADRNLG